MKGEGVDRPEAQLPVQAPPTQNQLPQKQPDATPAPIATPAKPHTGYIRIWHILISLFSVQQALQVILVSSGNIGAYFFMKTFKLVNNM